MNDTTYVSITINGTLKTVADVPTWTCAGGVAEGQLVFTIAHSKFLPSVTARVVFTVGGGAAVMVAADDTVTPAFGGAGTYVRDAGSLTSCAPGASHTMSLCGAFTFVRADAGPPVRS